MSILNIAGYKFIALTELAALQQKLREQCQAHAIKGTILLSTEGINLNLAATSPAILAFITFLKTDTRFMNMTFHESWSKQPPFKRMLVKIKKEIITMHQPEIHPENVTRAPHISPQELKQWLDENRDITLLDTRNDYEVRFGTFDNAVNLHINDFGELPACIEPVDKKKPLVMFCTGGIRCEKAAIYMLNQGFENVQQLDGGILGYFKKVGGAHYQGECFVFDERVAVDSNLEHTGTTQCLGCQGPIAKTEVACPNCTTSS